MEPVVIVVVVIVVATILGSRVYSRKRSWDTISRPAAPRKASARRPVPQAPAASRPAVPEQSLRSPVNLSPAVPRSPARRSAPQTVPTPSAKPARRKNPARRREPQEAPASNDEAPQRREERHRALARSWRAREDTSQQHWAQISWRRTVITGKAYVIDGDTIRVSRRTIRLSGLDAPELDQVAKHEDGYWYKQGQRVKSELIRVIGGKHVQVQVEGTDKYGRVLGTVLYEDKDVGEWLVRKGYAIAAYGEQYKHVEHEARRARRGMWAHSEAHDPRAWRNR